MEDKNQEINQRVLDYIDRGQNFDDIPFEQQRQIVANMDQNIQVYGQEARGLYYMFINLVSFLYSKISIQNYLKNIRKKIGIIKMLQKNMLHN